MAEFTELFPLGKQTDGFIHMYVYTITFGFPTFIIVCIIVTLLFFIFYQILRGLFYWCLEMRSNNEHEHDLQEGTNNLPYEYDDDATGPYHLVTIFHAHVANNLQAWTMVATFDQEGDHSDEKRGQKLRASKKLPPLVNYGRHDSIRSCSECAICLEDFQVGQFCQVFPMCKHIFHSDCIDQWLQKKSTCPICRSCI